MTFASDITLAATEAIRLLDSETVVYAPVVGEARSISALVDREVAVETPTGPVLTTLVRVRNDATLGIASTQVDTGGDTIACAVKRGDTAQARRITQIVHQCAGMLVVEVA